MIKFVSLPSKTTYLIQLHFHHTNISMLDDSNEEFGNHGNLSGSGITFNSLLKNSFTKVLFFQKLF